MRSTCEIQRGLSRARARDRCVSVAYLSRCTRTRELVIEREREIRRVSREQWRRIVNSRSGNATGFSRFDEQKTADKRESLVGSILYSTRVTRLFVSPSRRASDSVTREKDGKCERRSAHTGRGQ